MEIFYLTEFIIPADKLENLSKIESRRLTYTSDVKK